MVNLALFILSALLREKFGKISLPIVCFDKRNLFKGFQFFLLSPTKSLFVLFPLLLPWKWPASFFLITPEVPANFLLQQLCELLRFFAAQN